MDWIQNSLPNFPLAQAYRQIRSSDGIILSNICEMSPFFCPSHKVAVVLGGGGGRQDNWLPCPKEEREKGDPCAEKDGRNNFAP